MNTNPDTISIKYSFQLPDYCQRFISDKIGHLEASSLNNYASDLLVFLNWGKQAFSEYSKTATKDIPVKWFDVLTEDDILEYLDFLTEYTTPDGSIRRNNNPAKSRKLSSIRALYTFLNREGYTKNNPVEYIKNPKVIPKSKKLTDRDKEAVIKAIETGEGYAGAKQNNYSMAFSSLLRQRNKAMYLISTEMPLRMPDIEMLTIYDVDIENRQLRIPSRKSGLPESYFTMSNALTDAMRKYINEDRKKLAKKENDALFITSKGERLSLRSMEHMIKTYTEFALKSSSE